MTPMSAVEHSPALAGPGNGGFAARRALIRWAGRMFRREWRQQVLVATLLAIVQSRPRSAASRSFTTPALSTTSSSAPPPPCSRSTVPILASSGAGLALAKESFGTIDVIALRSVAVPAGVETVDFRAQIGTARSESSRSAMAATRLAPDQVAVTDGVAKLLRLDLGLDAWRSTVAAGRSVGIVENPHKLSDEFALVSPSSAGAAEQVTVAGRGPGRRPFDAGLLRRGQRPNGVRGAPDRWYDHPEAPTLAMFS
jgi:putative ABC transport system permease protein